MSSPSSLAVFFAWRRLALVGGLGPLVSLWFRRLTGMAKGHEVTRRDAAQSGSHEACHHVNSDLKIK